MFFAHAVSSEPAAGSVAGTRRIHRADDRDALRTGIVGISLPKVVGAGRTLANKRYANRLRPGFHRKLEVERRGGFGEFHPLTVQCYFQILVLKARGAQADGGGTGANFECVLGVEWEGVADENPTASAERKPFDVIALGEV